MRICVAKALEVLVHLDRSEIPDDYVLMSLDLAEQQIPQATESEARERSLKNTVPILRVASVVVPRESNFVLYPDCPELSVGVVFVEPFAFDTRLFAAPRII